MFSLLSIKTYILYCTCGIPEEHIYNYTKKYESNWNMMKKQKILIVDDSEMNRALLTDMLEDQYQIVEAENGAQAVAILQQHIMEFSLMLLDIMMPEMDGFEVLAYMKKCHWDNLAVIMISAEDSPTYIKRAYDLGAFDYISRPFDPAVVHHRVSNTMLMYAKQRQLEDIVIEQIYEQEKNNKLMISILSHIVEFRNGESGLHILRVNTITGILLKHLVQQTERYPLSQADIDLICTASSLHDIGKISIPDEILNKPGRLTAEEFEIIKTHSAIGSKMLQELPLEQQDAPLVKLAFEICRWHHERYDGRGYPDGLKGDEIPISAQVVALADVYDALTSERCYKKSFSHAEALKMILEGQCGTFNPLLLQCLQETADTLEIELKNAPHPESEAKRIQDIGEKLQHYELFSSEQQMNILSQEQQKFQFLSETSTHVVFSYNVLPAIVNLNAYGAQKLGIEQIIVDPENNLKYRQLMKMPGFMELLKQIKMSTPNNPLVKGVIKIKNGEENISYHCICKTIWASETDETYIGVIGKLLEILPNNQTDYIEIK